MNALILAAGRGSRLLKLTQDNPKCMVNFNGRPLLQRQISSLREAGVKTIGIATGYQREKIYQYGDIEFHNADWDKTNMVVSLLCADKFLSEQPTVVSYSDIFYSKETVQELIKYAGNNMVLTYDPDWLSLWSRRFEDPISDAETFAMKEGVLTDIGGKIEGDFPKGQYMGLFKLTPDSWQEIKSILNTLTTAQLNRLDMTALILLALQNGVKINVIPVIGEWGEIDHPSDLELYESLYPNI